MICTKSHPAINQINQAQMGEDSHPKMSPRVAEALLIITTAIWGSTFIIIKLLVGSSGGVSAYSLLAIRFAIATIGSFIFFFPNKIPIPKKVDIHGGIIIGIFALAGYTLQAVGLVHTTPAKSGFLTSLFVLWTPFVSWLWEKERVPRAVWISLIPALIALWLISGVGESITNFNPGDQITFFSSIAWALQIVAITIYTRRGDWRWITIFQFAVVAIVNAIIAIFTGWNYPAEWTAISGVVYLGVLATVVALGVQMYAQRFTTSARASLVYISEPLFAAGFAWIIASSGMTAIEMIGGGFIILSMVVGRLKI